MRAAGRDLAGKAALLECFNEEAYEVVWQLCCRCVGVTRGQGA